MARACGAAWAWTWTTTELHQTSCSTTGPRQASCSTSVQLRKFITIRQLIHKISPKTINVSPFLLPPVLYLASPMLLPLPKLHRAPSSAVRFGVWEALLEPPSHRTPMLQHQRHWIGWRWRRRALDWLAMEKESWARRDGCKFISNVPQSFVKCIILPSAFLAFLVHGWR